jgi:hypothetical protein
MSFSSEAPDPVHLFPVDGNDGDLFGRSVAIWEDTLVVGVPEASSEEFDRSGAVHVYTQTDGDWVQTATLTAPQPVAESKFGTSVAVYEDTIVVGEPNKGNMQNGAAYVFTRDPDNTWSSGAALTPDETILEHSKFGSSVAIWGETIVVGAPEFNLQRGAAFIFVPDDTDWKQEGKLIAPNEDDVDGGYFGCSVAIWDDWVIVGAYTYKGYGDHVATGAAFGYQRVDGNWDEVGSLMIPEGVLTGANFYGNSVAIWETRAVVGAPSKEDGQDKAYVFELTETGWDWTATLDHSETLEFGTSVSLWEDRIAVSDSNFGGSLGPMSRDSSSVGALFLFELSEENWTFSHQLQVSESAAYGASAVLHQTTLAVGDTEQGSTGFLSVSEKGLAGSVYIYELVAGEIYFPFFLR